MHNWQWQTWKTLPYLTCDLLQDFSHGFFTQQFSPRSPDELTPVLATQARAFWVRQVHGGTVLSTSEIVAAVQSAAMPGIAAVSDSEAEWPPADGVLTEQAHQAAWVCTADCVPALIADVSKGQVSAVHAGWRGTAARIVPQAIARLKSQGSRIEDLRVALGPAIAGEVYQVSKTVAAEVGATLVPVAAGRDSAPEAGAVLEALWQLAGTPLLPDPHPGRVRLDVRQVNLLQLLRLGLTREQVAIAPYCTYQTPDHFYSYRRDPQKKVQWSGIVSR